MLNSVSVLLLFLLLNEDANDFEIQTTLENLLFKQDASYNRKRI